MDRTKLANLMKDSDFNEMLKGKSQEEITRILKDKGFDVEEIIKEVETADFSNFGELTKEELENVAGGAKKIRCPKCSVEVSNNWAAKTWHNWWNGCYAFRTFW